MIYTYYASEQTHNHPQLTPVLIWSVECGVEREHVELWNYIPLHEFIQA